MPRTVCIRNADWVVAWDSSSRRHAYLGGGDVAFAGNAITFVGKRYGGAADETIDGRGLLVMPGLVDVHAHPGHEASYRGIREEHGVPELYMTGLFERSLAYWPDKEGRLACAEAAYCKLLLSGVTTLVDISGDYPGWVELIARSGLRGVLAPSYASSRWLVRRPHLLEYEWKGNPWMMPARDPLRPLIFHAADRAVRDVYVDGQLVVSNGRVLTLDRTGALERLTEAQRRMEASVPQRDPRGRRSEEIAPLSLPAMS